MILSIQKNLAGLRTLEPEERLEAITRLLEMGRIDFFDACDSWLAVGGDPSRIELFEMAARGRLKDLREFYSS